MIYMFNIQKGLCPLNDGYVKDIRVFFRNTQSWDSWHISAKNWK